MTASPARRAVLRRAGHRAAAGAAAPAVAGALICLLTVAGEPVQGPWQWTSRLLLLVPCVLVHVRRGSPGALGPVGSVALSIAAAAVAYAVAVVGLVAGAALSIAVVVAAQTGVLAALSQLAGIVGLIFAVRARRPA